MCDPHHKLAPNVNIARKVYNSQLRKINSNPKTKSDIIAAESQEDEEVIKFLRKLMEEVDENDWSKNVLITLISDAGTRTFAVEAGRSQEGLRAFAAEFTG